ncbi:LysR family transcriptional regulator [Streptomyces monticola]|uniref:LysR family transcriptional regulator n=1 Tax=Streptomyces monticola TaxID=2666263 RepID=A0ABW2JCF4_9ACTN
MIDPRLQTLRVLHAQGTVTAAAAALHLTPSTVSQQLRQLAAELGVELLRPEGRRVRLTPAALTLIEYADGLHARWEEATAALDRHRSGVAGHIRVSGVATALAAVVAPALRALRAEVPDVTCHLSEDPGEDRTLLLLTDRTDIAVVIPTPDAPLPDPGRLERRHLLTEPLDLLVPDGHALAHRDRVELTEAAAETWIRAGDPADQLRLLLQAAAGAGFTPRLAHAAVDWYAVAALVACGHGVALLPRLAPLPAGLPVRRVPLAGRPAPTRSLVACVRRGSAEQPVIARTLVALETAARDWQGRSQV